MNKRQHFNKFIEPKAQLIECTSTNSPSSSSTLGSFLKCTINGKVTTVFPSPAGHLVSCNSPSLSLSFSYSLSALPELAFIVTEFDYENMLTPCWGQTKKEGCLATSIRVTFPWCRIRQRDCRSVTYLTFP